MKKKQRITLGISVLILLVLGFWVHSRWHVWFGNPEEPAYLPLNAPGRVLLTFGDKEELSRNISWQYDSVVASSSFVELIDTLAKDTLRIEAKGEVFQSRSGKAAYYTARLRSLKPATFYSYRVSNDGKYSPWYNFHTYNQTTRNDYSFIYVGDVQDTINGKANQYLKEALQAHPKTEFFVFGGDLTERPMDSYWAETFSGLDSIGQYYPVLNVTGNHEYLKYAIRKLERRFPLVFSYFQDSMVGDNQVYTLRYNDLQLFLLDSNREFFYLWSQKKWLEKELQASDARWKIVVLHHPLYSVKGKYNNLAQKTIFNSLIQKYNVDLILQGHEHAYARMTLHDEQGSATPPVYTVSHCSPKSYRITFDQRFDKYGIESRYYQYIRIHGDTLSMSTYEVPADNLYDSLDIVKSGVKPIIIDHGKNIPEHLNFQPGNSKKGQEYMKRIEEYKHNKEKSHEDKVNTKD